METTLEELRKRPSNKSKLTTEYKNVWSSEYSWLSGSNVKESKGYIARENWAKHTSTLRNIAEAAKPAKARRFFTILETNTLFKVGDEEFEVPKSLSKILDEIKVSKDILSLEVGWDGDSAKVIDETVLNHSFKFLLRYALFLESELSVSIACPEINPCPNGTIDLSWRTENARMLINIRSENGEMMAYYYGDKYEDKLPIKGSVPALGVQDYLACWMKNLALPHV